MELLLNDEVGQQKLLEELSQGGGGSGGGGSDGPFIVDITYNIAQSAYVTNVTSDAIKTAYENGQQIVFREDDMNDYYVTSVDTYYPKFMAFNFTIGGGKLLVNRFEINCRYETPSIIRSNIEVS